MFVGILSLLAGLMGLAAAAMLYQSVARRSTGDGLMTAIGEEIQLGAMTYLRAQYVKIGIFALVVAILLAVSKQHGFGASIAFLAGALTSALAGLIGMKAATKANVRTTAAARDHGAGEALLVAFDGGAVMGLAVASFGLIGLGLFSTGGLSRPVRGRSAIRFQYLGLFDGRVIHRPVRPGGRRHLHQSR